MHTLHTDAQVEEAGRWRFVMVMRGAMAERLAPFPVIFWVTTRLGVEMIRHLAAKGYRRALMQYRPNHPTLRSLAIIALALGILLGNSPAQKNKELTEAELVEYRPGESAATKKVWDAFYAADGSEEELPKPLIAGGKKMVGDICKAITNPNMKLRRYAMTALGVIGDKAALPTLEAILTSKKELDYMQGDALYAIHAIDKPLGLKYAKELGSTNDYLKMVAEELTKDTAEPSKNLDPDAIVKNLYAAHKAEKSPFFQTDDRKRLDPYFTKALGDLIWKDVVDAKGEIGKLDFDPLYGSQDPDIKDFVIMETGWGGDKKFGPETEAVVQVTFKDSGKDQMISFQFVQGKDKVWRIDDIRYPNLEDLLLKTLLAPEKKESKAKPDKKAKK